MATTTTDNDAAANADDNDDDDEDDDDNDDHDHDDNDELSNMRYVCIAIDPSHSWFKLLTRRKGMFTQTRSVPQQCKMFVCWLVASQSEPLTR